MDKGAPHHLVVKMTEREEEHQEERDHEPRLISVPKHCARQDPEQERQDQYYHQRLIDNADCELAYVVGIEEEDMEQDEEKGVATIDLRIFAEHEVQGSV
jgi:hypothetical protein